MENFTIIIPTLNRPQPLNNVLKCIEKLSIKVQEIIIINQGDNLNELSEFWKDKLPLTWLSQECPNPSAARNLGIQHSKGEWILFLDDDVSFVPDLLDNYLTVLGDLCFDACNGSVICPWETISPSPIPEIESKLIGLWSQLSSYRTYSGSIKIVGTCSANLLVKKSVLIDIGGFDERFHRLEDVELGIRITKAGYNLWHDGRPLVIHYHIPFGGSRNQIDSWEAKHLSGILPKHLGVQLLLLGEHFTWKYTASVILSYLFHFLRPSRLYLERPHLPFLVIRSEIESLIWALQAHKKGAKLGWKFNGVSTGRPL